MKLNIGIDTGLEGAIAWINSEGIAGIIPFQTYDCTGDRTVDDIHIAEALQGLRAYGYPMHVVVEKAQKFTLGRLALASTWATWGSVRTVLRMLKLPFMAINPANWQRQMGVVKKGPEDTKAASIKRAQELFPNVSLLRSARCRVPDHNMADALLMAAWGQKNNL